MAKGNDFNKDFIQYTDKKAKNETLRLAGYLTSRSLLYVVIFFFAIFFIWYVVFISTHDFYVVSGVSMMPTLNNQIYTEEGVHSGSNSEYDAVYVNEYDTIEAFDIVVINRVEDTSIIKRVMALEGDYITIYKSENSEGELQYYFHRIAAGEDTSTYTNEMSLVDEESGENGYVIWSAAEWTEKCASYTHQNVEYEGSFYETYIAAGAYSTITIGDVIYVQVPQGTAFYMGDNRAYSSDGRKNGFVDTSNIVGRAEFIVYDYGFVNRLVAVVKFYFEEIEKFFAR